MKRADLKVVESSGFPGRKSVRGPLGKRMFDPPQVHITDAGFSDGEDVVLITKADFDRMRDALALALALIHEAPSTSWNPHGPWCNGVHEGGMCEGEVKSAACIEAIECVVKETEP